MAYAAVADMVAAFGQTEIARLSAADGADITVVNEPPVDTALANASDLIDSHLRRRYACPLAVVPPAIKRACEVLARYDLAFSGDTEPSEQMRLARKETIAWLERLNAGSVTLEGVEPASSVMGARTQDRGRGGRVGPGPMFQPSLSGLGLGWGVDCW